MINSVNTNREVKIALRDQYEPVPHERPTINFAVQDKDDIFKYNSTSKKIARLTLLIFSIVIFPIGIVRLIGKVINIFATQYILPGVGKEIEYLKQVRQDVLSNDPLLAQRCNFVNITTADQVKLNAVLINHPLLEERPLAERKYILFLNGNAGSYEEMLPVLKNISEKTETSVLCGNYRGVGNSKGFPHNYKDLVMDGEAMVQFLLSQGVPAKNILIHGWSLGGGVGAEVAALHQEEGNEMHYCADRTFSSLAKEVRELPASIDLKKIDDILTAKISEIQQNLNQTERPSPEEVHELKILNERKSKLKKLKFLQKVVVVLAPLGALLVRAMNWNMNPLKCYKKIKGHKFIIIHRHDFIIPYKASLFKQLKNSQMSSLDKKLKKERRLIKKQNADPQAIPLEKAYLPKNVIRLNNAIPVEDSHAISIDETSHFEEYKDLVGIALNNARFG